MCQYGLSVHDLDYTKLKITKQREFLTKNSFVTANGQIKTFLDVSFAANHSERYYAQILNKVHTMDSYNLHRNHIPVFMTVTLDAPFHEMLEGKFTKFYKKYKIAFGQIIEKSTGEIVTNLVPNNDRYGFLIDAIEEERQLTVKELYRILSFQLHGFQRSYIFKKIKKDGNEVSYLRVIEPMKSGVPHFHLLLYTKKEYLKGLYDSFHKYFSAPQNSKPLSFRDNKRICTKPLEDGTMETQGFQWDINSASGYVLKYVLKSFRNVKNDEDIDYLQSWYINHKIPRIITSHTLVPQWVYHIMQVIDKDWYYLTDLKSNHSFESDSLNQTFEFNDFDFDRTIIYDNGLLQVYRGGRLFKSVGTKKKVIPKIRLKSLKFTVNKPFYHKDLKVNLSLNPITNKHTIVKPFNLLQRYEIYRGEFDKQPMREMYFDDGTNVITSNGGLEVMFTFLSDLDEDIFNKVVAVSVSKMSDMDLMYTYSMNDETTMLPARYKNIQNELVRRGLKDLPLVSLNDSLFN